MEEESYGLPLESNSACANSKCGVSEVSELSEGNASIKTECEESVAFIPNGSSADTKCEMSNFVEKTPKTECVDSDEVFELPKPNNIRIVPLTVMQVQDGVIGGESTAWIEKSNSLLKSERLRVYKCYVCGKLFSNRYYLKHHVRIHTGEKAHTCEVCDKSFIQKSNYTTHLLNHKKDSERPHVCHICKKGFARKFNLNYHLASHQNDGKEFPCNICGKTFNKEHTLRVHMKLSKNHGDKRDQGSKSDQRSSDHNPDRPQELIRLLKRTDSSSNNQSAQPSSSLDEKGKRKKPSGLQHEGTCHICGKVFKEKHLRQHMAVHAKGTYLCGICGKNFKRKYTLIQHKANLFCHLNNKNYHCDICEEEFGNRSSLRVHMKEHVAGELLACDVCGKLFTVPSRLTKHMNTHSDERKQKDHNHEAR